MLPDFYEFGRFRIDVARRILFRDGEPAPLSPKVFDTLMELVRHRGRVRTKDELMAAIWPDAVVEENSLARNISTLRRTLGESASDHRYIVTIPGRGYSFVATVRESTPAPQGPSDRAPVDAMRVAPRAGVPFRNVLVSGALAGLLAAGFLGVNGWRARALPFESIRVTRLTSAGQCHKAAISPNGRYIAYSVITSGKASLRVRPTASLRDVEVVPPAPAHYLGLTFSPDNESIYFVTHTADAEACLYRVAVMGGPVQKVAEDLASPVSFSPDGTQFTFARESAAESTLIIADSESGRQRKLVSRKLPDLLDYPAWSPDGRIIACTVVDSSKPSRKGSDARIVGFRVADGAAKPLSNQVWPFIRGLAWLGDGRGLLMSARDQESGLFHIWRVPYPAGSARQIAGGLSSQTSAAVSADSRKIVTVEESTFATIWRTPANQPQDALKAVVSTANCSLAAVWTPNGRLVFEQDLDRRLTIWTVDADGANQKQLMIPGNNYHPSVSGDGQTLACISDRNGSPAIWTMDMSGGNPVLAAQAEGDAAPQLSPDGKWIAFTAHGTGPWPTLWRVGLPGGQPTQLNDKLWRRPAISPDGKWIAGFYADRQLSSQKEPASIAVIRSDGGEAWKVFPIPPSVPTSAGLRWNPDGRHLTYVDRQGDGCNIWSQPLDGGAPHQLTRFHGEALFSFDWSRDGKHLAVSRGIEARDLVLIEDAPGQ